jgi:hypothetical protein
VTETGGGLDAIRDALIVRSSVHAIISRDCGCSIDALGSFANGGRADLPANVRDKVVNFLWNGFVVYDAELDLLHPKPSAPARSVGVLPVLDLSRLPKYQPGPSQRGIYRETPAPAPKPKPGWAGVW